MIHTYVAYQSSLPSFGVVCTHILAQKLRKFDTLVCHGQNSSRALKGKEAFDWIQNANELIVQLLNVLSQSVKAWKNFRAEGGDVGYFHSSDFADLRKRKRLALQSIDQTFKDLESHQDRLISLKDTCFNSANAVSLWHNLSHRAPLCSG